MSFSKIFILAHYRDLKRIFRSPRSVIPCFSNYAVCRVWQNSTRSRACKAVFRPLFLINKKKKNSRVHLPYSTDWAIWPLAGCYFESGIESCSMHALTSLKFWFKYNLNLNQESKHWNASRFNVPALIFSL